MWEHDPGLLGKPAASDHPELFIGYTPNHWRVCQGRQGNGSLPAHTSNHKPTHKHTLFNCSTCTVKKNVCFFFLNAMTPKLSVTPTQRSNRALIHISPLAPLHILNAHHVRHLSGLISTKCHKNVTEKCHSLITHTDQNSAVSHG